ncbi:fido domain-containing protein [Fusarium oxysporum f. sp. albedinis]|nr:fido domain-containing protein [Fusarium oxysporum f. sp. albedinis]
MSSTLSKATFTINMGDAYDYNILQENLKQLHQEFRMYISDIADGLKQSDDNKNALDEYITDELARMVYGSNMIEVAGGGVDITLKLCKDVFQGKELPEEINERDEDYHDLKIHLLNKNLPSGHEAILRSRREIVQHAEAARYMIDQVCIKGKDLSHKIISEAHGILTYKIDLGDTPWPYYSGVKVPAAMRDMIDELDSDIKKATEEGQIDPVVLASKYCHKFVNIHPFADGNGRMCRLILNALLLKYSGRFICIGQDGQDRQEYLRIAVAASVEEGSQSQETGAANYKQLASFTLRHARDSMRKVRQLFKRDA